MILRTRSSGDVEYRTSLGDLASYGLLRQQSSSSAGMLVSQSTASSLPAYHRAVTIAAEAVAQCTMGIWRGRGDERRKVANVWQARLFRETSSPNPGQSWYAFWYIVEASLTCRNNAYIWKTKNEVGRPVFLTALSPDQVTPRIIGGELTYAVTFDPALPRPPEVPAKGQVIVGPEHVHHVRGAAGLGELVCPTPVELFRATFGAALAKQEYESRTFGQGVSGGLVVRFPAGITPEQANAWRTNFESEHAGPQNVGKTKVVGAGAEVTQLGMTSRDAQWLESVQLSIADIARITRVTASLLGAGDKHEKPESPEHEQHRWVKYGLLPRLARIEGSLSADPDLFGATDIYPAFVTDDIIRGDLLTEDQIAHQQIQDGRLLVDEWRLAQGRPPLPDGLGMIPQVVPVGGTPNPN